MQVKLKNLTKIILTIILSLFVTVCGVYSAETEQQTLQGYVKEVPDGFFGTWRVSAKLLETDSPASFKEKTVDLWNILQVGDVIKLSNPFSGASAEITIKNFEDKTIEFSKTGKYGNQILTDTVEITITEDTFSGFDTLKLDTKSEIDGSIRKTSNAKYLIKGERISGQKIKGE